MSELFIHWVSNYKNKSIYIVINNFYEFFILADDVPRFTSKIYLSALKVRILSQFWSHSGTSNLSPSIHPYILKLFCTSVWICKSSSWSLYTIPCWLFSSQEYFYSIVNIFQAGCTAMKRGGRKIKSYFRDTTSWHIHEDESMNNLLG